MSDDKVVFLAFNNDKLKREELVVHACGCCRNKTFIIVDHPGTYAEMRCSVCSMSLGPVAFPNPDGESFSKF